MIVYYTHSSQHHTCRGQSLVVIQRKLIKTIKIFYYSIRKMYYKPLNQLFFLSPLFLLKQKSKYNCVFNTPHIAKCTALQFSTQYALCTSSLIIYSAFCIGLRNLCHRAIFFCCVHIIIIFISYFFFLFKFDLRIPITILYLPRNNIFIFFSHNFQCKI